MHITPPRRFRFNLNTIFLLSLGIAIGYAWNLWVWRLEHYMGSEANMLSMSTYVIEPPDVLRIEAAENDAETPPAISGEHLVAMDGRVNLGEFGSVYVTGMTIAQSEDAIKKKLAEKLKSPRVVVDVTKYNSKVFYIVLEDRLVGNNVIRAPISGNETILDAIALVEGLQVTDATEVWISRPAPNGVGPQTTIPVNYHEITCGGVTARNYQLFPGDRVFISQKNSANQTAAAPQRARSASKDEPVPEPPMNVHRRSD